MKILVWGMGVGWGWEGAWLGMEVLENMASGPKKLLSSVDSVALGRVRSSCPLGSQGG